MGKCLRDHSGEEVLEKMAEVPSQLTSALQDQLRSSIEQHLFTQAELNELFHVLKKLEKDMAEEEKEEVRNRIQDLATHVK